VHVAQDALVNLAYTRDFAGFTHKTAPGPRPKSDRRYPIFGTRLYQKCPLPSARCCCCAAPARAEFHAIGSRQSSANEPSDGPAPLHPAYPRLESVARGDRVRYTARVFYAFLMVVAIAGIALYLFVIFREVPGAAEERLGTYEDLPEDVNKWRADAETPEARAALEQGLQREVRLYFAESDKKKLIRQARYRNVTTGAIERVEPDVVVKRKRVKH
jgi:hypothetical protein